MAVAAEPRCAPRDEPFPGTAAPQAQNPTNRDTRERALARMNVLSPVVPETGRVQVPPWSLHPQQELTCLFSGFFLACWQPRLATRPDSLSPSPAARAATTASICKWKRPKEQRHSGLATMLQATSRHLAEQSHSYCSAC